MSSVKVITSLHFRVDPAKLTLGVPELPEEITKTIAVGDFIHTEKVPLSQISDADMEKLEVELNKLIVDATRTAKPVAQTASTASTASPAKPSPQKDAAEEEVSLFT